MNFRRFRNSIAARIILVGLCLILAGNVARYLTLGKYLRENISEVKAEQQLMLANYVAREVGQKMLQRQQMLTQMATTLPLELLQQPQALQNWLTLRHQYQPLFSEGLVLYTPDGKPVASDTRHAGQALLPSGALDWAQLASTGTLEVGRPVRDSTSQQALLPLVAPVKDTSGKVRALLVGVTALAAPGFLSFSEQDRIGETGSFLLVSARDKLLIAATDPKLVLTPSPPPGANVFNDRAMQGDWGSGITVNAYGVEEIAAIAPVPSTGWFVVARVPTAEALSVVSRVQRFVALNSVWTLFLFLFITTIPLYFVFRPLLQAAEQADRMTLGEIPLEPLNVVRQDEVGHLTEAFNRLLAKLRASQSEMAHMAHHDVLTGLPNRALLADRLTQAMARAARHGKRVAFLCIDLDQFKPINDELGHAVGDMALKEVARRLSAVVRSSDTLARIGGDEFAVLLTDLDADPVSAQIAATVVAEKFLVAMRPDFVLESHTRALGASIGIAMGSGAVSPHTLQLTADSAMYKAKNAGGQRHVMVTAPQTTPA
ncbi:diguanylate cyclase domain-containing protein [Rhodoferax saidenbachensis]|uniref:GGDEF domain-containing protein n=1 Tax=Rhodoferax saidenbachensis TaxID=1484693 RepID=A0A1P8K8I2_9BURK|nr:diguanylate cyclase [Rhodoferax saidenbachensis]APW42307.1 GGDEF domain-containing protein [Rhodoferax saidenbachensis]